MWTLQMKNKLGVWQVKQLAKGHSVIWQAKAWKPGMSDPRFHVLNHCPQAVIAKIYHFLTPPQGVLRKVLNQGCRYQPPALSHIRQVRKWVHFICGLYIRSVQIGTCSTKWLKEPRLGSFSTIKPPLAWAPLLQHPWTRLFMFGLGWPSITAPL